MVVVEVSWVPGWELGVNFGSFFVRRRRAGIVSGERENVGRRHFKNGWERMRMRLRARARGPSRGMRLRLRVTSTVPNYNQWYRVLGDYG
jgi:hypothetical protein